MTKLEYLKQLEDALKNRMSRKEIDEIIRDYAEYFAEGERQGKSEFETVRGLGTPQEVADQILSETMSGPQQAFHNKVKNTWQKVKTSSVWNKVFLIVLIVVLSPFLLAAGGLVLAALGIIAMTLVSVILALLGAVAASFAVAVCGVMGIGLLPASVIAMSLIVAVGMLAGSVLGICLCLMLVRWLWRTLKKLLKPKPKYRPIHDQPEGVE